MEVRGMTVSGCVPEVGATGFPEAGAVGLEAP